MESCNGYRNKETWIIALMLCNDETTMNYVIKYRQKRGLKGSYQEFVRESGLKGKRTFIENVKWDAWCLDTSSLDKVIRRI